MCSWGGFKLASSRNLLSISRGHLLGHEARTRSVAKHHAPRLLAEAERDPVKRVLQEVLDDVKVGQARQGRLEPNAVLLDDLDTIFDEPRRCQQTEVQAADSPERRRQCIGEVRP